MDRSDAESQFAEANDSYLKGRYDRALDILTNLEGSFPDNHRIIKAKAQTLAKLGRHREAIYLCDRLINEFGYEKARAFRERLAEELEDDEPVGDQPYSAPPALPTGADASPPSEEDSTADSPAKKRRFRIKPVRLLVLVALIAGMYSGRIPYWLGGGLIVAYFAAKYAISAAIYRLFTIPFKMKGKALEDATVELHGFEWTEKPEASASEDADEDEERKKTTQPLRYAWIDVTITPLIRTRGFTHWEPGELMLASAKMKIRGLDDMDKCHRIHAVRFIVDGQEQEDEGYKVRGPQRIKVLAELPEGETDFKFVYYTEVFGTISLHE